MKEHGLNQHPKSGLMKYPFDIICSCCQKKRETVFYVAPELPGENFRLGCGCGNVKMIDDIEIVFIADTLKSKEIIY